MKVLQILPELNAGGVERGTLELADFLVRNGHEALVVSQGGRLVTELERFGAHHITLAVHRKSLFSLLRVGPFRRLLEQERPDILHLRSRVPGWIAWLAWRKLDPRTRPQLVTTVHGFYSVNAYSAIMTRGERVIAVSESIRDYILKSYPATSPERIRTIPRGIQPEDYPCGFTPSPTWLARWHAEFPQLRDAIQLVLPGRITRLKGHEDFIQLVAALNAPGKPVCGVIVGDVHPKKKAYLAELEALVNELGVRQRVVFTGHRTDLREILATADMVYSLSQQPESFGRTTLEALALGRPVVAYDHGGVGELLQRFFPAGRVPLGNLDALFTTTRVVLLSRPTPEIVGAPYTLTAMCEATLNTYRELLRPQPGEASTHRTL